MKLQLKPLTSDIIISIYVIASLYLRLKFENDFSVSPLFSLITGLLLLFILYALIKLKVLNPGWFGLFNHKKIQA